MTDTNINSYRRALIKLPLLIPFMCGISHVVGCSKPLTDDEKIKADFLAGRTVIVDGWILSEHEALLFTSEK